MMTDCQFSKPLQTERHAHSALESESRTLRGGGEITPGAETNRGSQNVK